MPHTTDRNYNVGLDPVTINWTHFNAGAAVNPKTFPVDSVVYYVAKHGNYYTVEFGIVLEHYMDAVCLQKIELRENVTVISEFAPAPVLLKDFPDQTEWRKLPRGWHSTMELFQYSSIDWTKEEKEFLTFKIDDLDAILRAYKAGVFVDVRDNPHSVIHSVIEKQGYKLVKYRQSTVPPDTVGIDFWQCFSTYEEALKRVREYTDELKAQAEMTDLEWSIHEIDRDLDHWAALYHVSDENKARARAFLMNLKDLENIETRICNGSIQYKHWQKTRWMSIPVD